MSISLYRHLQFVCDGAQEKNLVLLARYLLIHGDRLVAENAFNLEGECTTQEGGWEARALTAHQAYCHIGPIHAGPIGYGPIAGWCAIDPRPRGVALRMMYALDYGVPNDWQDIMQGRKESDYDDNGVLFNRVGLMDPRYEKTKCDTSSAPLNVPFVSRVSRLRSWLKSRL